MFCDGHASAGDDKSCRCRHIESLRAARAGSSGIDETRVTRAQLNGAITHGLGHSREFLDRFPFGGQERQSRRHLRVRGRRAKQLIQKIRRLAARKVFSAHQTGNQSTQLDIADFADRALRVHAVFIWLAIASAFIIARALLTVSSYSRCGSESATMPAPAWKYAFPFFSTAHRSAMQESKLPSNPK